MPGIADFFFGSGARHAPAPNAPVPPVPGNIPNNTGTAAIATPATAANGVTPSNGQGATAPGGAGPEKSPFAEFENLWQAPTGPDGKPITVTADPLFTVDNNKVMEAARRTSFKGSITQEQMAKVAAGGPEAVNAMVEMMERMSQDVYANSAVAATKIAEQGITKAMSQAEGRLPNLIRNQQLSESMIQNNPALQNPAVKPLVDMVRNQFIQKNPTASMAEVTAAVNAYMSQVGDAFNPAARKAAAEAAQQQQASQEDWGLFFNDVQ